MNDELRIELITMADEDQQLLEKLSKSGELADWKDDVHPELKKVLERNTKRVKEIIADNDWPGISNVGEKGSTAMWLIVQHSVLDQIFMQSCVPILERQVKNNEAKGWQLAFLRDRTLMQQDKPQIYGTQHIDDKDGVVKPYKIQDPEKVDEFRKELGLEPLAEKTALLQEKHNRLLEANKNKNLENS
jgi:hypothetical protein